jgi:DNA-binding MarR family transcriptional regulator
MELGITQDQSDVSGLEVTNRLFFRLFQVGNTLHKQSAKELGVSGIQWAVMGALARPVAKDGMSFLQLLDFLKVSRQNLDGVIKRLEREKYVTRVTSSEDRRARTVVLTDSGRAFWVDLQPKIHEFYRQAVVNFRFDDKVSLLHFLNRLAIDLDAVRL